MNILEKFSAISDVMTSLIDFVQKDEEIKADFQEYLVTIGAKNPTEAQLQSISLPYIFERNLGEDSKSILELFLKNQKTFQDNKNDSKRAHGFCFIYF